MKKIQKQLFYISPLVGLSLTAVQCSINRNNLLEEAKERLYDEIQKLTNKRGKYRYDYDSVAFDLSTVVLDKANKAYHDEKATVESINKAIEDIKKSAKDIDKYYSLTLKQKQDLYYKKFIAKVQEAEQKLKELSKFGAKNYLRNIINTAKKLQKNDRHFYKKIKEMTSVIDEKINEALVLEKKSYAELLDLFLDSESRILSEFEQEHGNNPFALDQQDVIRQHFNDARDKKNKINEEKDFEQIEIELFNKINETIEFANKTALTRNNAKKQYDFNDKEITISKETKYIQFEVLKDYENLEKINFEADSTLESIGHNAFDNTAINELNLPQSLKFISGFNNIRIKKLILSENVTHINYGFNENFELEEVKLNNNLVEVRGFNFTKLNKIDLPESLIVFDGFREAKIKNITLNKNLKTFLTKLPELETLTLPANIDLDLITNDNNAKHGILISKAAFKNLKKIYVSSEEQKVKLQKKLNGNIKIVKQSDIEEKIKLLQDKNNEKISDINNNLNKAKKFLFDAYTDVLATIENDKKDEFIKNNQWIETLDFDFLWTIKDKYHYESIIEKGKNNAKKLNKENEFDDVIRQIDYSIIFEEIAKNKISINEHKNILKKYQEIVKNAEYYNQYLFYIAQVKVLNKYHKLTEKSKENIKKTIKIEANKSDNDVINSIEKFIYNNKFNINDNLDKTDEKINNLIALITDIGFELTNVNIANDEEILNEDKIKEEFELEKNKYENSKKDDEWNDIIEVKLD
ncbi:leucine-rich repeat protein [Mycoplasmopsis opalescens]|uniref:leucine-rich repeat protein n=1 Tax=Mycoplasmopsis opalescens TaxID=114886 RepID=UPI0004A74E33|nr:leucine-rich repeat protein [Mycoplasmopsis opalescens]